MKHLKPRTERRPPLSPKIRFGVGVTKPDKVWADEDHIPPKTDAKPVSSGWCEHGYRWESGCFYCGTD